ncbi:MAG: hypothetical protein KBH81_13295, partial [Phycisphaerae bacterium]|nr:hypothetical protein [Phycisphaerae bacterium]
MAGVVLLSASVLVAGVATFQPATSGGNTGAVVQPQSPNAVPAPQVGTNLAGTHSSGANAPADKIPANTGNFVSPTPATTIVMAPTAGRLYGFDTSVGSAAPPDTLGTYLMTRFGPDPSPTATDVTSVE